MNLFSHEFELSLSLRKNSHRSPWKLLVPDLIGGADDAALIVPELSRGVLGNKVEFLNGVRRRGKADQVVRHLVVVHAVQDEVVGLFAVAVDIWPAAAGGIVAVIEAVGIRRHRPGRQQRQLHIVARGQRQRRRSSWNR